MFQTFGMEYIIHVDDINPDVEKMARKHRWSIDNNNLIIFNKYYMDKYFVHDDVSTEYNDYIMNLHHHQLVH